MFSRNKCLSKGVPCLLSWNELYQQGINRLMAACHCYQRGVWNSNTAAVLKLSDQAWHGTGLQGAPQSTALSLSHTASVTNGSHILLGEPQASGTRVFLETNQVGWSQKHQLGSTLRFPSYLLSVIPTCLYANTTLRRKEMVLEPFSTKFIPHSYLPS